MRVALFEKIAGWHAHGQKVGSLFSDHFIVKRKNFGVYPRGAACAEIKRFLRHALSLNFPPLEGVLPKINPDA